MNLDRGQGISGAILVGFNREFKSSHPVNPEDTVAAAPECQRALAKPAGTDGPALRTLRPPRGHRPHRQRR
jgi:hypothetical protein